MSAYIEDSLHLKQSCILLLRVLTDKNNNGVKFYRLLSQGYRALKRNTRGQSM